MTKMKPLSQRDIRDLTSLRIQRGLRLPDLAKELGIAERTLSRYFEGTLPRNNDKGRTAYTKIHELLKEFRSSAPKDLPKPKAREKRATVAGVFINNSLVIKIHDFLKREKIDLTEFASRLDISESHMLSVMNQEAKASIKLRDNIIALITKSGDEITEPVNIPEECDLNPLLKKRDSTPTTKYSRYELERGILSQSVEDQSDRDTPLSEVYTHEFRLRADFVLKVDLPTNLTLEEAGRVSAFIQLIPLD